MDSFVDCTPFSGPGYKTIVPSLIPLTNVTYNDTDNVLISAEMTGV